MSANVMSQQHAQQPMTKRLRAGSITGRLRAASDLEESGYINRSEKGVLKDLIISGDVQLQEALDKYERGDQSELAVIVKSLAGRRHSIDLLESLDLDFAFLTNEGEYGNSGGVNSGGANSGGMGADVMGLVSGIMGGDGGDEMRISDLGTVIGGDDDPDGSWRSIAMRRRSSLGSAEGALGGSYRPYGFEDLVVQPSPNSSGVPILFQAPSSSSSSSSARNSSNIPTSSRRVPKSTIDPNIFETQVELNAYALHAQELTGTSTRTGVRSTYGSRSSTGITKKSPYAAAAENAFPASGGGVWAKAGADGRYIGGEKGYIGAYSPEARKKRIERFIEKRARRVWTKKVKVRSSPPLLLSSLFVPFPSLSLSLTHLLSSPLLSSPLFSSPLNAVRCSKELR
jgi:hypothetical protein